MFSNRKQPLSDNKYILVNDKGEIKSFFIWGETKKTLFLEM